MVHKIWYMGFWTAISGADRYRGGVGKKSYCVANNVSENLGRESLAVSPFFHQLGHCCYYYCTWDRIELVLLRSVPTVRFSGLAGGYNGGQLGRYRARMLNGRRGSSDDHPLLVTARDVPARASQKPYGTREGKLMRRPSCRNLGKRAQVWGRGGGGRSSQGHDATRLSASRL